MSSQPPSSSGSGSIDQVKASAERYAAATTALSQTIKALEVCLNNLHAKCKVAVGPTARGRKCLAFERVKEKGWALWVYDTPLKLQFAEKFPDQADPSLLRDATVETKLELAPLLPVLLEKIGSTMNAEAKIAEDATRRVEELISQFQRGGK